MLGDRGRTPHEVLAALTRSSGGMGGMDGMGGTGESMTSTILGGAGDVDYPHYLINGRLAAAPDTFTGKPGQRVRLRLINAGSDTAFRVALAGHEMTVTHTDGFPVVRRTTDAPLIGMGDRFHVEVTLGDGGLPTRRSRGGQKSVPPVASSVQGPEAFQAGPSGPLSSTGGS